MCQLNGHVIKTWCTTQSITALSSGEAEYYGLVRGAAHGIGIKNLLMDFGVERRLKLKTDATVAKSIASRRGAGKIRHIEVNQLWLQEKVNNGSVQVEKVRTDENLADLFTKFKAADDIHKHAALTQSEIGGSRNINMPSLAK